MPKLIPALLASAVALGIAGSATARDGCGPGAHRGPWGHCRPNHGPAAAAARERWEVGRYYEGRGYWDGRRWYRHRARHREGWRYW